MKKLNVPYFSQLNNDRYTKLGQYIAEGNTQCNPTSNAMALAYLKPDFLVKAKALGYAEPESYFNSLLYPYGVVTDHGAITQCLKKEFGITSEWSYSIEKKTIIAQLDKNKPVPMGVKYKSSGHIVCCVGYTDSGLLIHDPYGIRYGIEEAYDVGADGSFDKYSWPVLKEVYWDLGSQAGWGRLF